MAVLAQLFQVSLTLAAVEVLQILVVRLVLEALAAVVLVG
jgi:hypothetical protein